MAVRKRDLIDSCRTLRSHAVVRHLATEEEVAGYWPARGAKASLGEWIQAYAQLVRLNGRQEFLRPGSEYSVGQLMDALSSEPVEVKLDSGEVVHAYPKSYHALRVLEVQAFWIEWLGIRVMAIQTHATNYEKEQEEGTADPLEGITQPESVIDAAVAEIDHRMAVMAWVSCWEKPGVPWAGSDVPPPKAVPALYRDLSPLDIHRIQAATVAANISRLRFLPKLGESGKGVTPDVFFATRADKTGRPMRELMMDEALAQQIAEVSLAAHSIEEAMGSSKKGKR